MIILGIDPGFAIVGYGVIEYQKSHFRMLEYGAVTTEAGEPFNQRLEEVYRGVGQLMDRYHPDVISIESLFFTNNKTTGIMVAEARGVILLAAAQRNIPTFEYTPMQVKQAVVGYGKAVKQQVMEMTRMMLHLAKVPQPDDAADALAIAICHANVSGSSLGPTGLQAAVQASEARDRARVGGMTDGRRALMEAIARSEAAKKK